MHTENNNNNGPESGIQPRWERLVPASSRRPRAPQPPSLNTSLQKLHQVVKDPTVSLLFK